MQKTDVEEFTLSTVTHGRIYRRNGEIFEIRIIKRVNGGNSFIRFDGRDELMAFKDQLIELEQKL